MTICPHWLGENITALGFKSRTGGSGGEESEKGILPTVGARRIASLTRRIEEQVGGPPTKLIGGVRRVRSDQEVDERARYIADPRQAPMGESPRASQNSSMSFLLMEEP